MRRQFQVLVAVAFGCALFHCGGTVEGLPGGGSGAAAGRVGGGHAGVAASAGHSSGGSAGVSRDAGFDVYVDPGCPDASDTPPSIKECDPFTAVPSCTSGEGCFPFVDHPFVAG